MNRARERMLGQRCGVTHYQSVLAPANHDRSEQLATRTDEVRTLEGLLHQIEVHIDPALTKIQLRPAVAIDRKNEMSVSAFEKVLTNALRRQ